MRVVPRVVGAATVTLVGGVVFVNGQPVAAATFEVTNLNDSGAGSLRQAILDANASLDADTIVFDPTVFDPGSPVTITLTSGRLVVSDDVTIIGPGEAVLTLTNATGDVIYVYAASMNLSGVTISDASYDGIAVNNADSIYINSVTVSGNGQYGIGVNDTDSVVVDSVTSSGNESDGIFVSSAGSLLVRDSVISGNDADGIDVQLVDDVDVEGSQVVDNGDGANDHGIEVYFADAVDIVDTVVTGNSGDGVYGRYASGPVSIDESTISNNANEGIDLRRMSNPVTIEGSELSSNGGIGIELEAVYDRVGIVDTMVSGSGDFGIELDRVGGSVGVDVVGTVVSESGSDGLDAYLIYGTVSIEDSEFSSNGGRGIDVSRVYGDVDVVGTVVSENTYDGLYAYRILGAVSIEGSEFSSNGDTGAYLRYISGSESDVVVTDSRFIDNDNEGFEVYSVDGGVRISGVEVSGSSDVGIYLTDVEGDIVIESTLVTDNALGIYLPRNRGTATLSDVTIARSTGPNLRVYRVYDDVLIERLTSSDATAGPGIDLVDLSTSATIVNSTVSGNAGGGVTVVNSEVSIEHSTVVDNDDEGVDADSDSVISLDHSIVAGNSGSDVFGASVSAAFSLLDVGSAHTASGTGNVETPDPLLAPLADNGGATPTRLPLELSPAIGGGDPAIASPPATDQRGAARIVQTIDIGAVEVDAGRVDISPAAVSVPESAGSVAVTVTRSGGTDGEVSVTVSTSDGSAVQPGDYTSVVEVVSWASGETGPKVVDVPIATDGVVEPDETFTVSLGSPTGGVEVGDATTVVTITDTPPPTTVPDTTMPDTTTTPTTVPDTTMPTTTMPDTTMPTTTIAGTPTTTVPATTTTLFDGGAGTLPATGGGESTGRFAWFGALLVALGAVASRFARRPGART